MSDLAIDVRGVSKRYDAHVGVRELSLQVPRGMVYGLLGPNGAGKTTTIRMLLDIIAPDTGTITLLGRSHREPGVLDRVGYLPEERGLYKKMKVRDVLRFLGALKGLAEADADRRIDAWLERLQLKSEAKDWSTAKVDELSRGMQQKVQFVATLIHDPELVILDEPFSGLDPINAQAMKDTVVALREAGRTVIFSTHIMDNAERLCDAVCIVARGEKVLDGRVADVKAAAGTRAVTVTFEATPDGAVAAVLRDPSLVARADVQGRRVELETATGTDASSLLAALVGADARIESFTRVQPSLHRIFLERVGATGVEAGMTGHG